VIDPSNTQPPVAAFTAPAVNAKVTELTAVTGTISDNGPLARWKLEYRPADGSASWTVLKEVTSGLGSSVNVSESFDPTLLANGAEPGHEGAGAFSPINPLPASFASAEASHQSLPRLLGRADPTSCKPLDLRVTVALRFRCPILLPKMPPAEYNQRLRRF
jgi:hypothetical protein